MQTIELGQLLLFAIGVAALVPSAATLLRRTQKAVRYELSVSLEGSVEEVVEQMRASTPSEIAAQLQALISRMESYTRAESEAISSLMNQIIADVEKAWRRDFLHATIGWLISAICCFWLSALRSELSLLLLCLWVSVLAILYAWNVSEGLRHRLKIGAMFLRQSNTDADQSDTTR